MILIIRSNISSNDKNQYYELGLILCSDLLMIKINIIDLDWFCALICYDFIPIMCCYHDQFFPYILFITIKTEIARCEYKYTLCHMKMDQKKEILYTFLILSHHHSHIHNPFSISLSKKNIKEHIEGGRKKKHSLHSLFLSHYHPTQTHLIFISLEKKNKNIRKWGKE